MGKHFLLVVVWLLHCFPCNATAQYPDKLIYKGDTIPIFSNPLEPYLKHNTTDTLPGFRGCGSTACWRGYVAVWALRNDSLFLTNITPCYTDCRDDYSNVDLKELFGNKYVNGEVFADWVDQTLLSPQGRRLRYIHMGYASIYERELLLSIKNGRLTKEKWVANSIDDPELIDRFNYDLMQDTLFHYISKLNWNALGEDLFCDDYYSITISKRGRPKYISYNYFDSWWEKIWWNLTERKCRRKVFKAIKHLRFDQLKIHGKPQKEVVKIELFWNDATQKLEHSKW